MKLCRFLLFLICLILPLVSKAEWEKVAVTENDDSFYIDFKTIKKSNEYVSYWTMINYMTPNKAGTHSIKVYEQAECSYPRNKLLSLVLYTEPMGNGLGDIHTPKEKWSYPLPETSGRIAMDIVCEWIK